MSAWNFPPGSEKSIEADLPNKSQFVFDEGHGFKFEFDGILMENVRSGSWIQYNFGLGYVVNEFNLLFDDLSSKTFVCFDRRSSSLVGPDITFFKEGKFIKKETL